MDIEEHEYIEFVSNKDTSEVIKWMREKGLLKTKMNCKNCFEPLIEYKSNSEVGKLDGIYWKCDEKFCGDCNKTLSIRTGSMFNNNPHIPLQSWLQVIHMWSLNVNVETKIQDFDPAIETTILEIYSCLRKICEAYFVSNPVKMEKNDKPLLVIKEFFSRGNLCILAIVDDDASVGYLEVVEKLDEQSLNQIIERIVTSPCETKIYENAPNEERVSSYLAKHERISKITEEDLNSHLNQAMWFDRFGANSLSNICHHIRTYFDEQNWS